MTEEEFLIQIEIDLFKCIKTIRKYGKKIPGHENVPHAALIRNICFIHTHLTRKLNQPEMEVF
jgi:hypothetical protein